MKQFFWHDESTEMAQAYIQQYRDDISALEKKYEDREKSFEQHMNDMRYINSNLESISGKYKLGSQKGRQGADEEKKQKLITSKNSRFYLTKAGGLKLAELMPELAKEIEAITAEGGWELGKTGKKS